jgi:predicted transcriptional regulator
VSPGLGELERAVMRALWDADRPLTVREVQARVRRRPALAYTTVLTVLDRLHDKQFVQRDKDGRAFRYRPRIGEAEWVGGRAAAVLAGEAGTDRAVLAAFVASAERADPALLDELSELIETHRRRERKR